MPSEEVPPPRGEQRVLNLREPIKRPDTGERYVPAELLLTRSTATGTVAGYAVYTQRRGATTNGTPYTVLCARIDAPDGRTLHTVFPISGSTTNSRGPTSTFFGGHFGLVFKDARNAEQQDRAEQSVRRAFEEAWSIAAHGTPGPHAQVRVRARIQAAASLLDEAEMDAWLSVAPWYSAVMDRTVTMTDIGVLHHAGFTPVQALEFYGNLRAVAYHSAANAQVEYEFAQAGWSVHDVGTLSAHLDDGPSNRIPPKTWAQFSPGDAITVAQAGLSPREIRSMRSRGTLDMDAVRAMAALRAGATPDPIF